MDKFSLEYLTDFTKEQKYKLMQFAGADKDYVERSNTVQAELESIEIE